MYRKRHQKRGGWPEFLDQTLEQAREKASDLMDTMKNSATNTMNTMQNSATNTMDTMKNSATNTMDTMKNSATNTMDTMKNSANAMDVGQTQSGSGEPNRLTEAIMVSNDQNIPPVQEGGKSRRKKRKRTKRKRSKRSSVRQRR